MAKRLDLKGRHAVVTGAASGIGRALAMALAARGAHLYLCDIDEAGLEATAVSARRRGVEVLTRVVDVADRGAMAAFAEAVHARVDAVDLLVNNAGVAIVASFLETSLEDWDWIVGVNQWGVIHGLHGFVPPMVAAGRGGHVVNIASMAGLAGFPHLDAYSTTKFAVVGLSESLRQELEPLGIGVTVVCPGPVTTPIIGSGRRRGIAESSGFRERLTTLYEKWGTTPERLAEEVMEAIADNRPMLVVTSIARFGHALKRLSPGLLRFIQRQVRDRLYSSLGAGPPGAG